MNIILVVVDDLRADRLGCYGHERNTSPNIDTLADKGIKFENCFSCANITDPSITTILSGRHPLHHGVMNHGPNYVRENRKKIKETGTKFISERLPLRSIVVDYLGKIWGKGKFSENREKRAWWKRVKSWIGQKLEGTKVHEPIIRAYTKLFGVSKSGVNPEVTLREAREKISGSDQDFFLFLHDWTVHGPWNPPKKYRRMFKAEDSTPLETVQGRITPKAEYLSDIETLEEGQIAYDASVRWVDEELGKFVNWLKDEGKWEDTIFVLTADHGECLGVDRNIFFSHSGFYDSTVHVPLIINNPQIPSGNVDGLASHIDIAATLLDLIDVSVNWEREIDGESLVPLINGEKEEIHKKGVLASVENLRMIRTKKYKLIKVPNLEKKRQETYWYDYDGTELYDLENDPKESENIAEKRSSTTLQLEDRLNEMEKKLRACREKSKVKQASKRIK